MGRGAKIALWIGGGLIALAILTTNVVVAIKVLGGGGQPVPVAPVPSQPLASLVTDAEHRAVLSAFYRDFADVLSRDSSVVTTTGQFYVAHPKSLTLLLQQTGYPRYAGLDQAIDARLQAAIKLDDAPLTGDKRAALVACLTQISKELGG